MRLYGDGEGRIVEGWEEVESDASDVGASYVLYGGLLLCGAVDEPSLVGKDHSLVKSGLSHTFWDR